jgi:hypothetical protein
MFGIILEKIKNRQNERPQKIQPTNQTNQTKLGQRMGKPGQLLGSFGQSVPIQVETFGIGQNIYPI